MCLGAHPSVVVSTARFKCQVAWRAMINTISLRKIQAQATQAQASPEKSEELQTIRYGLHRDFFVPNQQSRTVRDIPIVVGVLHRSN